MFHIVFYILYHYSRQLFLSINSIVIQRISIHAIVSTMLAKGHVFIVDDDHDIRIHLGDLLRHQGYGVSDFPDAESFLLQAKRCAPAVLILDMRMPQMSGLNLQKSLLSQNWFLPIIYMSGESQSQEIIDAMKLGAMDFLWKPFAYTELVKVIDKGMKLDSYRHAKQQRLSHVATLHHTLSPREKSMLELMLLGHGNKDISLETGLMADTVKKYRAQILAKMEVHSLAELLALFKDYIPLEKSN
jgi:FixJ family two-component response regulator